MLSDTGVIILYFISYAIIKFMSFLVIFHIDIYSFLRKYIPTDIFEENKCLLASVKKLTFQVTKFIGL